MIPEPIEQEETVRVPTRCPKCVRRYTTFDLVHGHQCKAVSYVGWPRWAIMVDIDVSGPASPAEMFHG